MNILVYGAGALGSVVGGLLAKSGHTVTLVGRARHMDAIRDNGLRITGIWGDHTVNALDCHTDVADYAGTDIDCVIVAVKSYDTAAAATALKPMVGENTLVCSYQNGLGNAETLAAELCSERVFGARVIYGARIPEPGSVDVTVIASPTALGTYDPETSADRVREIADAMNDAGAPTIYTDRIATVLWSKVAYNCALNPMSALLDVPYGEVGARPDSRAIIEEVIHEFYAVGRAEGIALEPDTPEAYLRLFFDELLPPTAEHYASMREDLLQGRRTEIDALNGAIVRYGDAHGIPTPVNATLTRLIRARET